MKISPWYVIGALTAALAWAATHATAYPMDDHFHYQLFIETLAAGKLDLSIPGFHGMNMLVVPWYWISHSPIAQIEFQMASGVLLPFFAFLATRELFKSTWHGVVFAIIIALMPFHAFGSLRGYMVATYNCLFFLTIYGAAKGAKWTWLPFGFSIISLPFSLALIPLLIYLTPKSNELLWKRYRYIGYGLIIPTIYVLVQIYQVGQINVGVHQEFNQMSVWGGPKRMFLNAAHSIQILFSVHNYYFIDPAKTGHGNMLHTSPLLVMLGIFALIAHKEYFKNAWFALSLFLGFAIGIGLNIALDHMDDFYMQTGVYFIMFAALPVLKKYPLWIPLVLATLQFQWLYFYLQFGKVFALGPSFFVVPVLVDIAFVVLAGWYLLGIYRKRSF